VAVSPVVHSGLVNPVVYHAPNCTTVEETVTLKKCEPKTEKVCSDVEIPVQKVEFKDVCNNVTTVVCTPVLTEVKEAEEKVAAPMEAEASETEEVAEVAEEAEETAEVVKRAADPQLMAPFHPLAGIPVLYSQNCEDKVEQYCVWNPVVNTETKTVESCQLVTTVECEDVEQTVPRTSCTHGPHVFF